MRVVLGGSRMALGPLPQFGLVMMAITIVLNSALSAQSLPTPESVLGFRPGADFHLATYEESLDYFQRLHAASDLPALTSLPRAQT